MFESKVSCKIWSWSQLCRDPGLPAHCFVPCCREHAGGAGSSVTRGAARRKERWSLERQNCLEDQPRPLSLYLWLWPCWNVGLFCHTSHFQEKLEILILTCILPILKCWQLDFFFFLQNTASQTKHVCRLSGYVCRHVPHRPASSSVAHTRSAPASKHAARLRSAVTQTCSRPAGNVAGCGRSQAVPRLCHPIFLFCTYIQTALPVTLSVWGAVCHSRHLKVLDLRDIQGRGSLVCAVQLPGWPCLC